MTGSLCFSIFSDKSKYGFRMLEQMGWQEGKGLGVKEDGGTQHVKVSKRVDHSGNIQCAESRFYG